MSEYVCAFFPTVAFHLSFASIWRSHSSVASKRWVNGVLYEVSTLEGLNHFVDASPLGTFTVVLPFALLNVYVSKIPFISKRLILGIHRENIQRLQKSGKMVALLVLQEAASARPSSYSPASPCPNCEYGLYADDLELRKYPWNPKASCSFLRARMPLANHTDRDRDSPI